MRWHIIPLRCKRPKFKSRLEDLSRSHAPSLLTLLPVYSILLYYTPTLYYLNKRQNAKKNLKFKVLSLYLTILFTSQNSKIMSCNFFFFSSQFWVYILQFCFFVCFHHRINKQIAFCFVFVISKFQFSFSELQVYILLLYVNIVTFFRITREKIHIVSKKKKSQLTLVNFFLSHQETGFHRKKTRFNILHYCYRSPALIMLSWASQS